MMQLTKHEEAALAGDSGDIMQMAYRVLVAAGEATGAQKLVSVEWVHLSGVNYNTIGDAGEEFLRSIRGRVRVRVPTTLNPMGFDRDHAPGLDQNFLEKQYSIEESYRSLGVALTYSCVPYDIIPMPAPGAQVALAESNAAIHANTFDGIHTNKESAFSALASAITGKSPQGTLRGEAAPDGGVRMDISGPTELEWGMLGFFAGRVAGTAAAIYGAAPRERLHCKAFCGGMGTSGTCGKAVFREGAGRDAVSFGMEEARSVRDELGTADDGDAIILGSPQLGAGEMEDLAGMLGNRRFRKKCIIFCPRAAKGQVPGAVAALERAGCNVLADCCACLTPLISREHTDAVITNSIKGAYYMGKSNGVGVCLKPLRDIVRDYAV